MYFINSVGKVYIEDHKKLVIEIESQHYSYESNNPMLLQYAFNDYVLVFVELEERQMIDRFKNFMNTEF